MKTQEEVVRQHAVGPISIYKIYQEGYQDRELDDWSSFRREAAKEFIAALLQKEGEGIYIFRTREELAKSAVAQADSLIKQLKEEQK